MGLCISCEICNPICPVDAIEMEYEEGKFVPYINKDTCINCGKCFMVCPGADLELYEGKDFDNRLTGSYIEGYSAYTKNQKILKNSTSGGAISQLLVELLENDHYEGAFVLPFDMFDGEPARLELAKNKEKIKAAAKSKYLPASVYNVVERLSEESNPNYIIVGTPCQLKGIKNFIQMNKINDKNLLFLGLFCEKTLNFNVLKYFEEKFSKNDEKLIKFDYKNKEKDGWPGRPKLYFDSGRELVVDRKERIQIKDYFQLERCLYCLDKLNKQADISFGDCYISGKGNPGRSSIIIRTEKGKKVWEEYSDVFNIEKSSIESIKKSQGISQKRENLEFVKALKENKKSSKLRKRKKKIELGEKGKFNRIKLILFKDQMKNFGDTFKEGIKKGLQTGSLYLKDTFSKKTGKIQIKKPKNVVIFGGGLSNKGAQAMTFTVVDQMKRRFPIENIYLLSLKDFNRDEVEKNNYKFEILPWKKKIALDKLDNSLLKKLGESSFTPELKNQVENALNKADLFVDISGYYLSSQMTAGFTWGLYKQCGYLFRIRLAQKFSTPYFILPQSMGPFDYRPMHKAVLFPMMKRYLKYPQKIYPREPQGIEALKPFTDKNVERGRDIVLLNDGYRLENIFKNTTDFKNIKLTSNSVGIIPNNQVMKRESDEEIYHMYEAIVKTLLNAGKKVYILRHSQRDLYICENIKEIFSNNEDVKLLSEDMNAIELENIIEQLDFIVGSRYHSIIHAYKNGVPAVVIGWAVKYQELLKDFGQSEYMFEIRETIDENSLINAIGKMLDNHEKEKNKINKKLDNMRKNAVFEDIEEILGKT